MRSFNLGDGYVGICDTNHPTYGRIEHAWTLADFEAEFSIDTSAYDRIVYEPDRGMFFVVAKDSTEVQTFASAAEHPALNFIANHYTHGLQAAITEKIRNTTNPYYGMSIEEQRSAMVAQIRVDAEFYIMKHYNLTEQVLMHSLFLDPATTTEDKTAIRSVGTWTKSVMVYVLQKIAEIKAASTTEELTNALWDFSQFDATNPHVNIGGLIS